MKIGVYGGSFDPVHYGHLISAEQAREQAGLDEVWFVPAARHPLKTDHVITPFAHRRAMLDLALAGQTRFRIDDIENERPGLSYTADTLDELARRHPDAELFLLLGGDCLPDMPNWRDPQRIVARAELLATARPGWPVLPADKLRELLNLPVEIPLRLQAVDVPLIDLSSRDIRRRVAAGRSVRFMVPGTVEKYIREHRLYTTGHGG